MLLNSRPSKDYFTIAVYSYKESFGVTQYGLGAAIAVVMVLVLAVVSFFYVRQTLETAEPASDRPGTAHQAGLARAAAPSRVAGINWRRPGRPARARRTGLAVFLVMVFPIYWMIATAFKPGRDIL